MPQKSVFAITNVRIDSKGNSSTANMGIFEDFDLAEKLVLENAMDINEGGYYPYVVIEQLSLNSIYFIGKNKDFITRWYLWEGKEEGSYKPCDQPDFAKGLVHWIG